MIWLSEIQNIKKQTPGGGGSNIEAFDNERDFTG